MRFNHLLLAAARIVHPIKGPRDAARRFRFLAAAFKHRRLIRSWLEAGDEGGLPACLSERPQMIGVVEWPYLNKDWDVARRFGAVRDHYAELRTLPWLRMGVHETRTVSDLSDLVPGLRLVFDRPDWFLREGELTLNVFVNDVRVYSLSFILARVEGRRVAFIGAMQGRNLDNIESVYKDLTKKLQGARPRDFLFTVFQQVCAAAGVEKVFGVDEASRHHKHPYFGAKAQNTGSASYDQIWADRGGVPAPGGFFALPVEIAVRPESDIPPQKRPMYRRRYALYDRIRGDVERFAGRVPAETPPGPVAGT